MQHDGSAIWVEASAILSSQVSAPVWASTFQDLQCRDLTDDLLTVTAPSQLIRQRIERTYLSMVEAAIADAGYPELSVTFEVDLADHHDQPVTQAAPSAEPVEGPSLQKSDTTTRRYTFDTFVIGPSNRFAHAAALSVAETPARSYNPLFVYGSAGLGKTHLLQAIANYVTVNYPGYRVRYISTETLLNEFVDAIRQNTQAEFKRQYREIDVLLVDDIQFMEGKEVLQEEFFHTFNTLYENQSQIVLSSDRPPDAIATLEDRLRSRFKMGLITDIQPPDFETRLAILQKKGEQSGAHMSPDVLEFIATNITYNIRELEGALIRVGAYATLNNTDVTVAMAEEILTDTIGSHKPRKATPADILEETAKMFGLDVAQLQSKSRTRDLVHARQIGMYVCRELTDLSYPQIGKEFGGRDHTTVIHAYEKVSNLMKERRQTYEDVTALIKIINNE
ncbi:MAG: chromosomal replication initiator protein DnaA [Actinomycetes bacterium]